MTIERMGPMDAWFLDAEEDGVNHMSVLSCIFLEGPPPPYEDLLRLVASKLPQLRRYRQVIRTMPLRLSRPIWIDDGHFDLEYHVRQAALPQPGDEAALEKLVSHVLSERMDRTRPLWELWSVEGLADGRWVLIVKLHHAMVDGVSGGDMVSILLDRSRRPERPPAVAWSPAPGPSTADLVADTVSNVIRSPVQLARNALSAVQAPRESVETAIALPAAKGTAIATGVYENRVTGVIADLPVGVEDPVERARLIRDQLAALKASKQGAAGDTITKLAGFAPATFLALGQRAAAQLNQGRVNSVVSNVPGPQVPLYALGHKILAIHPAPPVFPVGARTGVAVFSYNGNLHFGINADYSTVPDVHALRDGIHLGLTELLTATAGLPSAAG